MTRHTRKIAMQDQLQAIGRRLWNLLKKDDAKSIKNYNSIVAIQNKLKVTYLSFDINTL